jgi:hypothetical protein
MAYEFTAASSQYLSTTSAPVTAAPLTIAGWFYPTSTAATSTIAAIHTNGGTHRFQLFFDPTAAGNRLSAFIVDSVGTDEASDATAGFGGITQNTWQHAAGVYSSTTNRTVYYNGAIGSIVGTQARSPSGVNEIGIGARYNTTLSSYANARFADIGIWNVALTAAEIASLAKGMTCDKVRPQSLVFYAPLVRDLVDVKGGLTITNNNTATVANHPRVYA